MVRHRRDHAMWRLSAGGALSAAGGAQADPGDVKRRSPRTVAATPKRSVPRHFGSFGFRVHLRRNLPCDVDEVSEFLHAKVPRHLAQANELLANMVLVDVTHVCFPSFSSYV